MAGQLVQQAGLADVRAAEQGHPARSAFGPVGVLRPVGQRVEHQVEQVTAAAPVQRADRRGLAEPERPQRGDLGLGLGVVDLVGRDHDRLAGPAQHVGHRLVRVSHADGGVHDEQHRVGGVHRDPGLAGDLGGQALGALDRGFPAAGVDQRELPAVPQRVVGDPVPGHAGDVLYYRLPAAENPVDQRGLAHVGPADDGDDRNGRAAVAAVLGGTVIVVVVVIVGAEFAGTEFVGVEVADTVIGGAWAGLF